MLPPVWSCVFFRAFSAGLSGLAQIAAQLAVALRATQFTYGLLTYLTHSLTCETELLTNFLQRHLLMVDAITHLDDFFLSLVECVQGALNLR